MKLLELLEGWYDPPEYNEPSREGFRDESLDDVKPTMTFLGHDKYNYKDKSGSDIVVLMDNNTQKGYVFHSDFVPDEYYMSDYYSESDQDEDGYYSYDEFDDDNATLTEHSYEVFGTVMLQQNMVAKTLSEYEDGEKILELNRNSLSDLSTYEKSTHDAIINIITKGKK
jgi:hypothetical protein